MSVDLHYGGQEWRLPGVERASCQTEIMRLLKMGGGIAEFDLDSNRKIALIVSPQIPIALIDVPASAYEV